KPKLARALYILRDDGAWPCYPVWDAFDQLCEATRDCMKKLFPWIIGVLLLGWAVSHMLPRTPASGFDVASFGKLPVLAGGRVIPLDTLARVSLSQLNH